MAVTFTPIHDPMYDALASQCTTAYSRGAVIANPSGCALPSSYPNGYQRVLDFEVREDDVWIITYTRCGTAWTQEMVWLLMHELNFEKARKDEISHRSPYIELHYLELAFEKHTDWIDYLSKQPSPRCIKSHLPKELLPRQLWTKKPKIIYVARNPKDVLLSNFFFHQLLYGYTGSLELFTDTFIADFHLFSPFWKHVLDFWKMRGENILFNTYEEMKRDLQGIIRKTSKFLNKNYTDEQISTLEDHLSFKRMRKNSSVNYRKMLQPLSEKHNVNNEYMRKGESGAWRKDLPPELVAKIDAWSQEKLAGSDYPHYE